MIFGWGLEDGDVSGVELVDVVGVELIDGKAGRIKMGDDSPNELVIRYISKLCMSASTINRRMRAVTSE